MPPSNNEDLAPILSRVSPTQLRRVLARTNLLLWWADVRREGGAYKWKFEVSTASRDNSLTLLATALATGSGLWTIESAPDINEMRARSRAALANGEPGYEQQFRIVSGGRTHWLSESAAIEAVGENQWSVFGSVTDITPRYEAELARRESEVQFEKILDSVDCVLWQARVTLDSSGAPEWYFLLIPPTRLYRRIFGTNPSDSKHSLWTEEEVPDLGDLDRRSTEALLSGAAGYSQEFKIKRDGKLLWVREQVSIAAVGPGQWKVVGIITDVTVRREAEEARRESEAQLEEILEKADCILWRARVTIKADGSGTGWLFYKVPRSRLYRRMFNRDPYENQDYIWEPAEMPDAAEMHRVSLNALSSGAAGYEHEFRIVVNGRTYWLREQVSATEVEPGVWHVVGVAVDNSARRAVEAALAAEKERLAVTLSAMDEGVITIDLFGTVQFMNPIAERLTSCLPGAGVGRPMQSVFFLGDVVPGGKRLAWPVERVLGEGRTVDLPPQAILYSGPGQIFPIEGCCAPVRNDRGEITGAVLVFRDVTMRQRLEGELMRASKLESIGVLAGGIAHDFNNLLTAIMGNLALASVDSAQNLPIQEYLEGAQSASLRARDLTQQLLTFAKGGEPVRSAVQLSAVVVEVAEFASRGSNVKCEFDLAEDLWPADADKGQVGQIVQNLVLNATQAMEGGGFIRISASNEKVEADSVLPLDPGSYVRISVTDTGMGIQPQDVGKIFEPYFTTKKQGTGLGLATVYSIVRKHSGHIAVKSAVGEGTTFSFWLPAIPGKFSTGERVKATPKAVGKGRVLVMDDEQAIRMAAARILERFGFEAETAEDGLQAVALFQSAHEAGNPFALVVMDLTVPGGMGGVEALAEMRKVDPGVRAIVSSGYSSNAVMGSYEKYGFRGVLTKPYGIDDFGRVLGEVLATDASLAG